MHKKAKEAFDVLKELINSRKCLTVDEIKEALNLDLSERRTKDILDGLVEYFGEEVIQKTFRNKKTCYKLNDTSDLITEIFLKSDDISFILQELSNSNPAYLKKLEEETKREVKKLIKSEKDIFIFRNSILEEVNNKIFSEIKNAIKKRKYLKIKKDKTTLTVKPLKLVFVDNNWYVAVEDENSNFRFLRIAFIKKVAPVFIKENGKIKEKTYQKNVIDKYKDYFKTFQNSLTLYGREYKTAKILAKKEIAHYFRKGMKKFFYTQKFLEENENGVIFEIKYTQPLEILPFIKKWIPNLIILEPDELKEELKNDLKKILNEI
jgi:predicted DNA-binding transcriptional regulator YafY